MLLAGLGVGALASQLGARHRVRRSPTSRAARSAACRTPSPTSARRSAPRSPARCSSPRSPRPLLGVQDNPAVPDDLTTQAQVELASGVPFVSDADLEDRARRRRRPAGRRTPSSRRTPRPASPRCAPPSRCWRSSRCSRSSSRAACPRGRRAPPRRCPQIRASSRTRSRRGPPAHSCVDRHLPHAVDQHGLADPLARVRGSMGCRSAA